MIVRRDLKYWWLILLAALLVLALKIMEYKYAIHKLSLEWLLGLVSVAFLLVGFFWSRYIFKNNNVDKSVIRKDIDHFQLSPREKDVLDLMTKGYSNQQIAEKLFISLSTVKTHVSNILTKMGLERRTQAIQLVLENNIAKKHNV